MHHSFTLNHAKFELLAAVWESRICLSHSQCSSSTGQMEMNSCECSCIIIGVKLSTSVDFISNNDDIEYMTLLHKM